MSRDGAGSPAVGSPTRLQQPRLPTALWTVTDMVEGSSVTWESRSPRVVILAVSVTGPLSGIGWLLTRSLTKRYVTTEADSIKAAAEKRPRRRSLAVLQHG